MAEPLLVNIGCGRVWHRDWVNLDHQPTAPEVKAFDIRKPLPFGDGTVDAVYASHVLEHMDWNEARGLLRQCRRILKPGGILRVVVPDLEDLCRFYLQRLSAVVERPSVKNEMSYDWAYLQLIDQHVRRRTGGDLAGYLEESDLLSNPDLRDRLSTNVIELLQERAAQKPVQPAEQAPASRGAAKFAAVKKARAGIRRFGLGAARMLLPKTFIEALEHAMFLRTGELHRVGFDRFSLPRLLLQAGFGDVAVMNATRSAIPDFTKCDLDCVDGRPRKPGSLYVEAIRPRRAGSADSEQAFANEPFASAEAEPRRRSA